MSLEGLQHLPLLSVDFFGFPVLAYSKAARQKTHCPSGRDSVAVSHG
jgi:hypothetical protein